MRNSGKVFWGLFLIFAAILLLVGEFWGFQVGFVRLLFAVAFVAMMVRGIIYRRFPEIFLPLAGLIWLFRYELRHFLGVGWISGWSLLWVAILLSVGFSMIFRKSRIPGGDFLRYGRDYKSHQNGEKPEEDFEGFDRSRTENGEDGSSVFFKSNFSGGSKYINSNDFDYATLECNFGSMKVFFNNAVIQKGNATVDMAVAFGGVELYVPKEWRIVNHVDTSFGSLDEKNRDQSTGSPTLTLSGNVTFGGVTIIYV